LWQDRDVIDNVKYDVSLCEARPDAMVAGSAVASRANGLSRLQRVILQLALRNRDDPSDRLPADIRRSQVLVEYYGWRHRCRTDELRSRSLAFSPSLVGARRYRAGQVAVSKTMKRLEERGLVTRVIDPAGATLTDEGEDVARQLHETANYSSPNG
jgi:DNA-binding MarR family transcriptional regulator